MQNFAVTSICLGGEKELSVWHHPFYFQMNQKVGEVGVHPVQQNRCLYYQPASLCKNMSSFLLTVKLGGSQLSWPNLLSLKPGLLQCWKWTNRRGGMRIFCLNVSAVGKTAQVQQTGVAQNCPFCFQRVCLFYWQIYLILAAILSMYIQKSFLLFIMGQRTQS